MIEKEENVSTFPEEAIEHIEVMCQIYDFYFRNALSLNSFIVERLELGNKDELDKQVGWLQFLNDVIILLQLVEPLKTKES